MFVRWDYRGMGYDETFYGPTSPCATVGTVTKCITIVWAASRVNVDQPLAGGSSQGTPRTMWGPWFGSLPLDQQDASGALYMRNRYYDPATTRFTQEDPLGLAGGLNVYGFAAGDPVDFSDPFGLSCKVRGNCTQMDVAPDDNSLVSDPSLGPILGQGCPAISDACNAAPLVPKSGKEALVRTGVVLGAAALGAGIGIALDAVGGAEEVAATTHGAMRMADASRLSAEAVKDVMGNATRVGVQRDGARVFVQEVGGRYNVVVEGERGVVTNLKTIPEKALTRLATKYGWTFPQ